ncbi:hypothetical protein F2Q70_00027712 [Brassica cretica]|uniref:Uncharacterized protein n=1 Tax=Brassica cretica TaxID=69181 RepID=A0A8S9L9J2_BRACR|nr:hypothetical protein F2Q70_00027712 [Brassica cretica]
MLATKILNVERMTAKREARKSNQVNVISVNCETSQWNTLHKRTLRFERKGEKVTLSAISDLSSDSAIPSDRSDLLGSDLVRKGVEVNHGPADVNTEVVANVNEKVMEEEGSKETIAGRAVSDTVVTQEASEKAWSLVSPSKVGRAQVQSPSKPTDEVMVSASKFSILSDEVEEGEIPVEEQQGNQMNEVEVSEPEGDSDADLLEDHILDQQSKEKDKRMLRSYEMQDSTVGT